MPLIATCSRYRRQGMCRRLMNSIEEMLRSFKVEKLVISAIPSLVETWTVGFGFKPLEDSERRSLSNINLMVFPGTVWLKKPMIENQSTIQRDAGSDDPTETGACSKRGSVEPFATNGCFLPEEIAARTKTRNTTGNDMQVDRDEDGTLPEHFSKLSYQEPDSTVGGSQLEMVRHVESVVVYDKNKISSDEQSQSTYVAK
ncbi:hypothetical protein U1Q18_000764 [Sarracenia purpurea var. burkii]